MLELIVEAIREKLIVTAMYQGYERLMCPHVVGYKYEKNGGRRLNALLFQFAGGSKSGLPAGGQWRCIHLDELSGVRIAPGPWHTGPEHSQPQTCVDEVIAEVAY
jgi:hypothetical protein